MPENEHIWLLTSIPRRSERPRKLSRLHKSLPALMGYEMIAGLIDWRQRCSCLRRLLLSPR
jgi:hypothetical protein